MSRSPFIPQLALPTVHLAGPDMAVHLPPLPVTSAPWCFTKVIKPMITFFRSQGIGPIIYLDNILLFQMDPRTLADQASWVMHWLQTLGFVVNIPKSSLMPAQTIKFLGFEVDSV